jgi:hypothetical protein
MRKDHMAQQTERVPFYTTAAVRDLTETERARHPAFCYVCTRETCFTCPRTGRTITVPRGFLSDGSTASPDVGRSWFAHDMLYATHKWDDGSPCSRAEADRFMHDILREEGLRTYGWFFRLTAWANPLYKFSGAYESSGERGVSLLDDA